MTDWFDWLVLVCAVIGTLICVYLIAIGEFDIVHWFEED